MHVRASTHIACGRLIEPDVNLISMDLGDTGDRYAPVFDTGLHGTSHWGGATVRTPPPQGSGVASCGK